jgi:protoporphyrinogen oxidase
MTQSLEQTRITEPDAGGGTKGEPVVIIGAGPAGLTAAYELTKHGLRPIVLEKADKVGGLARTETYKGYRFDIGGHRFYTKIPEIQQIWEEMLEEEFIKVSRLSRIYYRGRFFNYPLNFLNALINLGLIESLLIFLSYLKAKLWPSREEETFEQWVQNRFGERLYRTFFKTYTEKIWGIPCSTIQAEWAAQRIKDLSLMTALANLFFGTNKVKTLIDEFHYPLLGPGMMWQRFGEVVENRGGTVHLDTDAVSFKREGNHIRSVIAKSGKELFEISGSHYITSMPITELVKRFDPPAPEEVLKAAEKLHYRDFLIVALIIDRDHLFPDNWIYVHNQDVKVGRIQNFKNWSSHMVPDEGKTCVGMEYFCNKGDDIWSMSDSDLIRLAADELSSIGLAVKSEVRDGTVIRQTSAYPVYDNGYREQLSVIQEYLKTIDNLQTVGRNGMHHYNNQDHSMLTGLLAVRNILGEAHDLWTVNTERSYYEEFSIPDPESSKTPAMGD